MPNKPSCWSYKMLVLVAGKSSICYDFIFYSDNSDKRKHGFYTDVVLDLCETRPRFANYNVYFDNYFTTIRLQIELKKLGSFTAGTVRSNRLVDLNIKSAKKIYQKKVEV